jgi:hypothetical protein
VRALRILERHASRVPWDAVGARVYALDELNVALDAAGRYRHPKALVRP